MREKSRACVRVRVCREEMTTKDYIAKEFPLHWFVWNNEYQNLQEELGKRIVSRIDFFPPISVNGLVRIPR